MIVYLDTSALVKRYISEVGGRWTRSLLNEPTTRAFTSQLTIVEGACTFARRRRESMISADAHRHVLAMFYYEFEHQYNVIAVGPSVIDAACELANRNPLRAYDAVHIATAWLLNGRLVNSGQEPLKFICADAQLLDIANREGLLIENPNDHP
jgi:predicted nucleic acid-binding protein